MKQLATLFVVSVCLAGCGSSSGDVATTPSKPGEGQAMNPSGKPQTPEAQALSSTMQQAGQAQSQGQAANAQAMADAMRKGGK